jgi:signal transduction histidine kinase
MQTFSPPHLDDRLVARANVLLVDDHPANLEALETVLKDLGHNLVSTPSSEDALRLLADRDFAVVLLDVQPPGRDGFETARLIRARERARHTPLIFLADHESDRSTIEQAYLLGAVDFLFEPLVPVILRAKLAAFIELFQQAEQVNQQAEQLRRMERREYEMKMEADQHKEAFLAMLAHELRNPLAPIRNAALVIRLLNSADPNVQRAAEMIERQVQLMARLIDEMLDVSRLTSGKVRLQRERVELSAVVARAVETTQPLIDRRRQQLTLTFCPHPVWLEGDAPRLAQAVANLLNNAAKYSDVGARISVTVEQKEMFAFVRVRDSGIGIASEMLPHVFDLFTQADHSLARSTGGLGIGLSLVRSLVERHGGRVEAFSEGPGKGSEFVVQLPVLETEDDKVTR